jgi:hypothetical protein
MKTRITILLLIELLLSAALSWTLGGLRRAETQAIIAWQRNPTVETRADLDIERAETFRRHVILSLVFFGGLAVITVPVVLAFSGRRSSQFERDTKHAVNQSAAAPPRWAVRRFR